MTIICQIKHHVGSIDEVDEQECMDEFIEAAFKGDLYTLKCFQGTSKNATTY